MKRAAYFMLCLAVLIGFLLLPASAVFYVTHDQEHIYAGGIMDLYAWVDTGDPVTWYDKNTG